MAYECPVCEGVFTRSDAWDRHFNVVAVNGRNLKCRDHLRSIVKKDVWNDDIPKQLRDTFKGPFTPKLGPGP